MRLSGRKLPIFRTLLSLLSILFAHAAAAQLLGPEFQVNSYTTDDQTYPAIASDAAGNFVVVWTGGGQDGSGKGIFGQRFDAAGNPAGGEFQVHSYTTLDQYSPAVASDAGGNFLVVWKRFANLGSEANIFGQRFAVGGAPAGGEFQLNSSTSGYPNRPAAAADGQGNFIVAWQTEEVVARRYGPDGVPTSDEFQVNSYTFDVQGDPSVAADAAGNFVVVWQSYGQDGSNYGIFAQRFDSAGAPQGDEFQVNSYTTSWQVSPAAAMGATGDFVVVWNRARVEVSGTDIVGQRFDAAGSPLGGEFPVSGSAPGFKERPAVALDASGGFVVTWDDPAQDGSYLGIYARRFDAGGAAVASEFQVNSYTSSSQFGSAVAAGSAGTFLAVWSSDQGQDGMGNGTFGQRLAEAPFGNGFESGDTCPWSVTVGSGVPCP